MNSLSLYTFSLSFTSFFSLVLGIFTIYKNPRSLINQTWSLGCLGCALWSLCSVLLYNAESLDQAVFLSKALNVSAAYMCVFVAHFCREISESKASAKLIYFGYFSAVLITFFAFTDQFASAEPFLVFKYFVTVKPLYHFFTFHFFFYFIYAQIILIKSLAYLSEQKKNQIKYIIVALFCGYPSGISTFLTAYHIPIEPFLAHFVWLYAAIISYAIFKHQLMDIKVVFRRTLFYSGFVFLLSIFYISLVFIIHKLFEGGLSLNSPSTTYADGFNLYSLPPMIGMIVFLLLGFIVLFNKPRSLEKTLFAVLCFETFNWQWVWFYSFYCPKEDLTYVAKAAYLTINFLPFTFYHFIAAYLKKNEEKKYVVAFYSLAAVLTILLFPTNWYVAGNRQHPWGNFTLPGPLFVTFTVGALFSMIRGLWIIRQALKDPTISEERRNQIKYLLFGFSLYFLCTTDFLQVYGAPWYPVGTIFFLFSSIMIAYAILKHQLLDIRIVIRKTIFYTTLTIAISLIYLTLVFLFYSKFLAGSKTPSTFMNFMSILFIAATFKPLEILLHRFLDRRFFKGTIGEISEQNQRLETELERRERLRSVGILAAGMAHEIKNPLTVINTFADYLPSKYNDPEFREKFSRIVKQEVARVKEIVTDLLAFSKPADPNPKQVDIRKIVMDVLELLSSTMLKRGIKTQVSLDGATAFVDPDQIKQALLNIIMNALDAMQEPGGELTINGTQEESNLKITIQDTGCGIAPDKIGSIFDPFYTDKEQGTGLGLAVTHSIIEKNRGKISVQSKVGEGTTFMIMLPLE